MLPSWLPLALQLHASPLSLPLVSPPLLPQPWLRTAVYNPKQLGKVWHRNPLYQENLLTCADTTKACLRLRLASLGK